MRLVSRLKPWIVMVLVVTIASFTTGAITSDGDEGPWLIGGAIFHGVFIALLVWSEGHTPSSAWDALRRPPREDL